MHILESECEDADQSHITQERARQMEIEKRTKTLDNVLRAGLCILTTIEMSYAINQNMAKYSQYIGKKE